MDKYKSNIIREQDIIIEVSTKHNVKVVHNPTMLEKTITSEIGQIDAYNKCIKFIEEELNNRPKYVLFKHQEINTKYFIVDFDKMKCIVKGVEYDIEEYDFKYNRAQFRVVI